MLKLKNLEKIDQFESFLRTQPELTVARQHRHLSESHHPGLLQRRPAVLPPARQLRARTSSCSYLAQLRKAPAAGMDNKLLRSFAGQHGPDGARISLKIADIGSRNLDTLMQPPDSARDARTSSTARGWTCSRTGTTILFTKGNEYLINTLTEQPADGLWRWWGWWC
ncbi:MAG: hypothetical protein WKG07_24290 [Hymenobacter sp.]